MNRSRAFRHLAAVALLMGLAMASASADERSLQAPGLWLNTNVRIPERVSPAPTQMAERMSHTIQIARQTPALSDLRGASAHPSVTVRSLDVHTGVLQGKASILLLPINLDNARTVYNESLNGYQGVGEGPSLNFHFNDLGPLFGTGPFDPAATFVEPRQIGEIGGYPLYDFNGRTAVLVTGSERPPWTPLTQEEHIHGQIEQEQSLQAGSIGAMQDANQEIAEQLRTFHRNRDAELAQMSEQFRAVFPEPAKHAEQMALMRQMFDEREKALHAALEATQGSTGGSGEPQRVVALRAELASLSPTQRHAPACHGGPSDRPSQLVACGPQSSRLARINPDFFDRAQPMALQSVVVDLSADRQSYALLVGGRTDAAQAARHGRSMGSAFLRLAQAREQMDLDALKALLH